MQLQKIILFYGFTPVADPEALRLWQKLLCESLGLKGRVLISQHGINGTLGGNISALRKYAHATKEFQGFGKINFKWSAGSGDHFARLSVKTRKELVAFASPDEITVDSSGITNGGKHLKPAEVHKLVEERGNEVVFFDGRNAFESKIGRFKNAIVPNVDTTHQFISELESGKYDHLKDKPIVTYCTGGIRCEILSAVMINRGFQEVYQIQDGIVGYGKTYKDKGLWEGSLYVFDKRITVDFSDQAKIIGVCEACSGATKNVIDCPRPGCRDIVLLCSKCASVPENLECKPTHVRGRAKDLIG